MDFKEIKRPFFTALISQKILFLFKVTLFLLHLIYGIFLTNINYLAYHHEPIRNLKIAIYFQK